MFQRVETIDHDARQDANLVRVGQASFGNVVRIDRRMVEAERVILTGAIIHHLIAGYSGGRKNPVPGPGVATEAAWQCNLGEANECGER